MASVYGGGDEETDKFLGNRNLSDICIDGERIIDDRGSGNKGSHCNDEADGHGGRCLYDDRTDNHTDTKWESEDSVATAGNRLSVIDSTDREQNIASKAAVDSAVVSKG